MTDILAGVEPEGWVGISLAAVVTYFFLDHLLHSLHAYRRNRGRRLLRALMLAVLLASGTIGILVGIVARYVPELSDVSRFVRWMSVGMLFVGGLTAWITWRWRGGGEAP